MKRGLTNVNLTVEQLDSFVKYHPEALKMWDEDRNELLFSVGLEDADDLIADLDRALSAAAD